MKRSPVRMDLRASSQFLLGLLWAAALWLLCNSGNAALGAGIQQRVLLLYGNRSDMLGNIVVDRTLRSVLKEAFDVNLDVSSEYTEVSPLLERDYQALQSWLRRKYSGQTFDIVIAVGADALRFVRAYDQDLFRNAQIVFWGRREALENLRSGRALTGVVAPRMVDHVKATFEFILKLQPNVQQVIVVSGASSVDRDWEAAARRALRQYENRIAVTYLAGLSLEGVQARLAQLSQNTAVLHLTMSEDGAGKRLLHSDVLSLAAQTAGAPVYGTSSLFLDTGIIGGALVNQEKMAREAAGMAVRLLRGERIENMPVREIPFETTVNWQELQRWGIPENRLPPGAVIMNKGPSIWELYKWPIIGITSLCAAEGLLIVALVAHRTKRKRAERAMQESKRLLQSTIDALNAHVALLDEDGNIIAVNQSWGRIAESYGYLGADESAGRNYLEICESCMTSKEARLATDGIRRLLSGELLDFHCVYSSLHAGEESWYQLRANRFYTDGLLRCVVAHENVTEIKRAQDTQQHLSGLLLRAQDEERRRIARDLHDVTVQNLATIKADLTHVRTESQILSAGAGDTFEKSLSICDQVIQELRTLSYLLHPPLLDELGLVPALQWFVRGFIQRSGVQVEILVMQDIERLATDVETALFRVVQESLTNIHRHSGSPTAIIWVTREQGEVVLRITDEGHGFSDTWRASSPETAALPGVGILGMHQRLKQLGGRLEIESGAQGTTVTARVSLSEEKCAANFNSR